MIKKIWQDGIELDGMVRGTQFKIEKEIDPKILNKIISNVEIFDASDMSIEEVEKYVAGIDIECISYMDPVKFPEAVLEKIETFPSEEIGWLVRGDSILGSMVKSGGKNYALWIN